MAEEKENQRISDSMETHWTTNTLDIRFDIVYFSERNL